MADDSMEGRITNELGRLRGDVLARVEELLTGDESVIQMKFNHQDRILQSILEQTRATNGTVRDHGEELSAIRQWRDDHMGVHKELVDRVCRAEKAKEIAAWAGAIAGLLAIVATAIVGFFQ